MAASAIATSYAQVVFQNHSVTPPLITLNSAGFPGVQAYGLIGSRDTLLQSPGYRFGGSADGCGILKNSDGTYTLLVNHEDNFSVSRIKLDNTFKPVKGEYILNSNAGMWRLCSATMATPEEHGFGPYFITCGETSAESMTHYLNPYGAPVLDSMSSAVTTLAGFGKWNAENAVPLPKTAYPGKTVVIIGDDDSGPNGGQVVMYVADNVGNLINGKLYVLRRTDLNQKEKDIPMGSTVPVEFVEIPAYTGMTGAQLNTYADATLKSIKFQRVEDIDYRKGSPAAGREIYFNATGLANADTVDRTCWGRTYRLKLDAANPLAGTLELIVNGDDKSPANPFRELYQPDNIVVTEDYVYIQEDPNGYTFAEALPHVHDARIYQYDIATKAFVRLLEVNHHRGAADSATYNRNSAGTAYALSGPGSWEFGAMVDVSKQTGINDAFTLCLQPHTWRFPEYAGVDGGTLRPAENQGSMLVTLTGVPRVKVTVPTVTGDTICSNGHALLKAAGGTTFYQTNGTTYKWYATATSTTAITTGATFAPVNVTNTTTYHVSTVANGQESARVPVTVTVTPLPATPTITANGNVLTSSAAAGNQWYRNGVMISGANQQTYTAMQDGFYSVETVSGGCFSHASEEKFVLYSMGIEEQMDLQQVQIFPNPNEGMFTLNINTGEASQKLLVQVVDMAGRIIFEKKVQNFNGMLTETIQLTEQKSGTYLVNISTDKKAYQRTIIKK